jgi:hypothetical protein
MSAGTEIGQVPSNQGFSTSAQRSLRFRSSVAPPKEIDFAWMPFIPQKKKARLNQPRCCKRCEA